jgi:hypothetical protein
LCETFNPSTWFNIRWYIWHLVAVSIVLA